MNNGDRLVARSGLKPIGMLLSCLVLFVVIAGRVNYGVFAEEVKKPRESVVTKRHLNPKWDVLDREGRLLATDERLLELSMSPRVMWQAHTPERIARGLDEQFAPGNSLGWRATLDRMLPDARNGVIQVRVLIDAPAGGEPEERFINDYEMECLDEWLIEGEEGAPVSGMWLQPVGPEGEYRICWMPELLLSAETRSAQGFRVERGDGEGFNDRPSAWSRKIADRLAPCLGLNEPDARVARARVWKLLMPDPYEVVFDRISISEGQRVAEFLRSEGVREGQMKLSWYRERTYPMTNGLGLSEGYAWLGPWRYRSLEECEQLVLDRHGLTSMSDASSVKETEALKREIREETTRRSPLARLEATCKDLFTRRDFEPFVAEPAMYSYLAYHPARAASQRSFLGAADEGETPRVHTTIDARLQNFLHRELDEVMVEHDAALAMGIILDVSTGDILAIDGMSQYQQAQFLPLQYEFTPGSTFKPIIAATAVDLGVVSPDDKFRTFNRALHVGELVEGCRRIPIGEARNSELGDGGYLTLRKGLAHSINAVMVQVGLEIPTEYLYSTLINLGYGQRKKTELGMTSPGRITPFDDWTRCYTQASVSFGHELSCTLWQHTAGLSTIIRGGERLPLRVLERVERGELKRDISAGPGHTVFSSSACEEVREMMRLAARIGTGKRFYEEIAAEGTALIFGCKSGTTQKEPGTSCAHLELACAEQNVGRREEGLPLRNCTEEGRTGTRPHSRSCYTASFMAFGSVGDPRTPGPRAGEDREVMVFIVVEEPRGEVYFGSRIAGPTAMAVLQEALGLTRNGLPLGALAPAAMVVPEDVTRGLSEDPVREIPAHDEEGGR